MHNGTVVETEGMAVCFVNTLQPSVGSTYKGCYVTKEEVHSGATYNLWIVEEVQYPHPQTELMNVNLLRTRLVKSLKETNIEASPLIVLYHAQQSVKSAGI